MNLKTSSIATLFQPFFPFPIRKNGSLVFQLVFICCASVLSAQVNLTSSDLPIMVIDIDDNFTIPDEPKIGANMRLINRGNGEDNLISDPGHDYEGRIAIEIRGSSSAALFPKVGYGFETQNLDESNNNVELLGMPEENDWVLHGPYSDKTLMRNALAYILAGEIMDYAPRVRHIELVINGEYQGVYLLTEKIKRDKNRVDISKLNPEDTEGDQLTGGYIFKIDKFTGTSSGWQSGFNYIGDDRGHDLLYHSPKYANLQPEQRDYLQDYIFNFENMMFSDNFNDPSTGYPNWIDEESFMNLFFVNEIGKNIDAYRLSSYLYKDRDSLDHRLHAGPVWDFNLAFGNADYCNGEFTNGWVYEFNRVCPDDYWKIPFFFEKLYKDLGFRTKIKERWTSLRTGKFSTPNIIAKVDSLNNLLSESQQRNFAQWPILQEFIWPNPVVNINYLQEILYFKDWITERLIWMDGQINLFDVDRTNLPPNFVLYPIPAIDEINLSIPPSLTQPIELLIYDSMGRLVFENLYNEVENRIEIDNIDVSNLPSGIYFYTVIQTNTIVNNGSFTKY